MPRVIITVPDKNAQPYRFQLDRQSVTLGRGDENDIAIDSGSVSMKHAEMCRVDGGYILRDLGSTNGIKLDNQRSEEVPLQHGISLRLGDVTFDFALTEEELEALAREREAGSTPGSWEPEKSTPRLPPLRDMPPRQLSVPVRVKKKGGGPAPILLAILLALVAFGIGMAIRFHKDTGGTPMDAIKANPQPPSAPATPMPAAPNPDLPQP